MLRFLICLFFIGLSSSISSWADEDERPEIMNAYVESGVLYCNAQTFNQEAYVLKVIGSGSPVTVFWELKVFQHREYWIDKVVASVHLGRQVIPDLVTKRWLMRDLSGGLVKYTSNADVAMQFLTGMNQIAVVDVSVLEADSSFTLKGKMFLHENADQEVGGWWAHIIDWGEDLGEVLLNFELKEHLSKP